MTVAAAIASAVRHAGALAPQALHRRVERRLSGYIRDTANGRYPESNRRVAEMAGLCLSTLGYSSLPAQ